MAGFNRYSNVPLYCQLKNIILEKIESGEYEEDSKYHLNRHYVNNTASRPTVRQVISELTNNGQLYKLKGKGTFVSKRKSSVDIKDYTDFTDSILDSLEPEKKEILSVETVSVKECSKLKEIFNIKTDSSLFTCITYLNKRNDEVFSYNTSYIPQSLFPDIGEDIKNKKPSYEILRGKYPLYHITLKSTWR